MTSPIKPPGGGPPKPPGGPEGLSKSQGPRGADGPDDARFRDAVADKPEVGAAGAVDPVVADLRAGRIDAAEAVDRLVARAMERVPPGVTEAGRAELEAFLREQLAEDPTLSEMVEDLERGR